MVLVVKAAVNAMSNRDSGHVSNVQPTPTAEANTLISEPAQSDYEAGIRCPRCTFENHPSLNACEMCNTSLLSAANKRLDLAVQGLVRSESPGPSMSGLNIDDEVTESIKFSFRSGGDKQFHDHLRNALIQRKWLLQSAPPVPKPAAFHGDSQDTPSAANYLGGSYSTNDGPVGIAGLERRRIEMRKNNELVIGNAFEDLEALMTSAKEVIALAEQFASQAQTEGDTSDANQVLSQSASALGLVTTRDMLGSGSGSDSLYVSELSRNLAEFLTDDTKGILRREGGIMSLVDLWAVFKRARGGVELVSPNDFEKAAQLWDKLKLPVRLRKFKSGLYVVQGRDRTDEKTVDSILVWLKELHSEPPSEDCPWDWQRFGRGVTAQEAAAKFGWSVGVATEELEMAEERGALCREQGLDGLKFWENWLTYSFEEIGSEG